MKNRRFTYIYILLAALLLGASYQLNYRDSKVEVYELINERFREEVPHWLNSISNILQKYRISPNKFTLIFIVYE